MRCCCRRRRHRRRRRWVFLGTRSHTGPHIASAATFVLLQRTAASPRSGAGHAGKLTYLIYEQATSPHLRRSNILPHRMGVCVSVCVAPHFIWCLFFWVCSFLGGLVIVEFVNTIYCYVCFVWPSFFSSNQTILRIYFFSFFSLSGSCGCRCVCVCVSEGESANAATVHIS